MIPRRVLASAAVLAAGVAVAGGRLDVAYAATGVTSFEVRSVPAVAGVRLSLDGVTRVTGRDGSATFTVPQVDLTRAAQARYGLIHAIKLVAPVRPDGTTFRVQRWYARGVDGVRTLTVALDRFVPTTIQFRDPHAARFAAGKVGHVWLKRNDGAVFTFSGNRLERPVLLQATRVVPLAGGLLSKDMLYRVQAVTIDGNNLVNRAQQAFLPAKSARVTLKLLFYSATFLTRDRLFRFPIGSSIELQFPNGRVHRYKLGGSGKLVLPALPRGNYRVTVQAPGLKVKTPVAMTRNQVATLNVVSYLDVATVLLALFAVAFGLLLVGRPGLRRQLRRWAWPRSRRGAPEVVEA